jgi:hypothetical protein
MLLHLFLPRVFQARELRLAGGVDVAALEAAADLTRADAAKGLFHRRFRELSALNLSTELRPSNKVHAHADELGKMRCDAIVNVVCCCCRQGVMRATQCRLLSFSISPSKLRAFILRIRSTH